MPVYKNSTHTAPIHYKERNESHARRLYDLLELKRQPVGIQFYYTEEEYHQSSLSPCDYKMAYCVYVEKASRTGLAVKTTFENHYCDGATTALGLEQPSQPIRSGRVYYSYGLYKTRGIAQKVWNQVRAFPSKGIEMYGIGIAPLETFDSEPDICIVIGRPLSIMRLTQGSLYEDGERLNMNIAAMQGVCSEITATPYLSGKIHLSLLCPSTRSLALWKPDEMMAGIPIDRLDKLLEGIAEIKKVK
ncbi:MAG: DUF169 domain-containing protein [Peptoniphilus sp.]|nr:DUF169 domain-containing protein [Peptoniphilus sp.]MDY3118928.1 DUF169 domain-containing protein [Peptoniphilus sp.]